MTMKKISAIFGMVVITCMYGLVLHWIGTQEGFWKIPALFVMSIFLISGIWVCLDIIFGKHESKDRSND